jgi:hypothetical protein
MASTLLLSWTCPEPEISTFAESGQNQPAPTIWLNVFGKPRGFSRLGGDKQLNLCALIQIASPVKVWRACGASASAAEASGPGLWLPDECA